MKSKKYVKKNKRETQKHKKNYKTQKYVKSIGNFTRKYLFKNMGGAARISIKSLIDKMTDEEKKNLKGIINKLIKSKTKKNMTQKMDTEEKYYYRYYLNKFKSSVNNDDEYIVFKKQKEIDDEKIKVIIEIAREHIIKNEDLILELDELKALDEKVSLSEEEKIEFYNKKKLSNKIKKHYEEADLNNVYDFLNEYLKLSLYDKSIHYMNNNKLMTQFIKEYNETYEKEDGFVKVKILPNYLFKSVIYDIENLLNKTSSIKSNSNKMSSKKSNSYKTSPKKNIQVQNQAKKPYFVKPL